MTRKVFLRTILSLAGAFFVYLFYKLLSVNSSISESNKPKTELKNEFPEGLTFVEDVIISKKENQMDIFVNNCTHLGCKLYKYKGDEILCPCHGSKFSADGQVLNGPAVRSLQKIQYKIDNSRNVIILENEF